jgi:rare lipoprotein A (peptidoglycan hydrolase)
VLLHAAPAALVGCLSLLVSFSGHVSVAFAQTASANLPLPEQKIPLHGAAAHPSPAYETGVASTYGEGDGFEGNLTACGQVFHTNVIQVAHKSLPCGTMIRIEDSDTGRSVVAEVTDRGPYISGRIVDLSWAAFRQLEPSGPGLLNVQLYLLDTRPHPYSPVGCWRYGPPRERSTPP